MKKLFAIIAIFAFAISNNLAAETIAPCMMSNKNIGGSDWNYASSTGAGQRGVQDGQGLNNIGLLLKTFGKVTYVDTTNKYFYVDDGSALYDRSGLKDAQNNDVKGIRISYENLATGNNVSAPSVNQYVAVTGISTTWVNSYSEIRPKLRLRKSADLQIIVP